MYDSKEKLGTITIGLHWLVGLAMMAVFIVGKVMEENEIFALYPLHKSIGAILLLAAAARVIWRIRNGWPDTTDNTAAIAQRVAKATHWILIIGTILFPLSGITMSVAGGHGLEIFGLELFASNPDPSDPTKVAPINPMFAGAGHNMHSLLGPVMIVALALHVLGALKHHFIDKDNILRRMLGQS